MDGGARGRCGRPSIRLGDISLDFNRLELAADRDLTIFAYTAEPGSRDEETLKLLGSWAATTDTLPATGSARSEAGVRLTGYARRSVRSEQPH
jgi:hypothetical protein